MRMYYAPFDHERFFLVRAIVVIVVIVIVVIVIVVIAVAGCGIVGS